MRYSTPKGPGLQDFLQTATTEDWLIIVGVITVFVFLLILNWRLKIVFAFRPFSLWSKPTDVTSWEKAEAEFVRFDYANMEGGNPVAKKDLGNLSPYSALQIDPIVGVVQFINPRINKMIYVVVHLDGKKYNVGDKVRIRYNPENPREAVIDS